MPGCSWLTPDLLAEWWIVLRFTEEMAIMKLLDHPNIVRLHEACVSLVCGHGILAECCQTFDDERNVYLVWLTQLQLPSQASM